MQNSPNQYDIVQNKLKTVGSAATNQIGHPQAGYFQI